MKKKTGAIIREVPHVCRNPWEVFRSVKLFRCFVARTMIKARTLPILRGPLWGAISLSYRTAVRNPSPSELKSTKMAIFWMYQNLLPLTQMRAPSIWTFFQKANPHPVFNRQTLFCVIMFSVQILDYCYFCIVSMNCHTLARLSENHSACITHTACVSRCVSLCDERKSNLHTKAFCTTFSLRSVKMYASPARACQFIEILQYIIALSNCFSFLSTIFTFSIPWYVQKIIFLKSKMSGPRSNEGLDLNVPENTEDNKSRQEGGEKIDETCEEGVTVIHVCHTVMSISRCIMFNVATENTRYYIQALVNGIDGMTWLLDTY